LRADFSSSHRQGQKRAQLDSPDGSFSEKNLRCDSRELVLNQKSCPKVERYAATQHLKRRGGEWGIFGKGGREKSNRLRTPIVVVRRVVGRKAASKLEGAESWSFIENNKNVVKKNWSPVDACRVSDILSG